MNAPATAHSLTPPPERHWGGPMALALLAHGLLAAALTWGIGWSRSTPVPVLAEAELWSRLPQSAAPPEVDTAPPPPEPPAPAPAPEPPAPAPDRAAEQRAQEEARRDADIALQEQKKRELAKREEAQRLAEREKAEKAKAEKAQREKAEREKAEREKAEALKKQQAQREAEKKKAAQAAEEAQRQAQKDKQAKAAAEKAQKAEAERLAKMRAENLQRMAGMAGASGAPGSTGTALKSSGPSATYAGRIVGAVRPNIVFTETVSGNPTAEVEVRTLPDGTIASRRLIKSSGQPDWDEAVLKALDRTARLPRDENGRVPGTLVIGFRPRD